MNEDVSDFLITFQPEIEFIKPNSTSTSELFSICYNICEESFVKKSCPSYNWVQGCTSPGNILEVYRHSTCRCSEFNLLTLWDWLLLMPTVRHPSLICYVVSEYCSLRNSFPFASNSSFNTTFLLCANGLYHPAKCI